jgi:hypothetical protein
MISSGARPSAWARAAITRSISSPLTAPGHIALTRMPSLPTSLRHRLG